jgi:hypothetical protein
MPIDNKSGGRILLLILTLCLALTVGAKAGEIRTFSKVLIGDDEEFFIDVAGTLDPENIEIKIENIGPVPAVNPRISVNDKYDWFDVNSIVAEVTADCITDKDKAMAIWEFVHHRRYQRAPRWDRTDLNPVRGLNCYGYGICGHTAAWLKGLWTAAGLDARVQEIYGHTVNEVYFDGAWHYMDGNSKVFYLGRDNLTLASIADVERDGGLVLRSLHGGGPWRRRMSSESYLKERERLIVTAGDNYVDTGYDDEIFASYDMSITLKPGESLTRWWKPVLKKYHARHLRAEIPSTYANGQLLWEPDLSQVDVFDFLNIIENITTSQRNGGKPGIQIEKLQDESYNRVSRFTIPVASPYPIVGGYFSAEVEFDRSGRNAAAIFWGRPPLGTNNALKTFRRGPLEFDLDYHILENTQLYNYDIGFNMRGYARSDPPAQTRLVSFKSVTDVQLSPHSLPALSVGRNRIHYRDSSPEQGKKIRVSWTYREIDDNLPPSEITGPLSPGDGEIVGSLAPVLSWKDASDPDDSVKDYQVLVSLRPDARWPVSTTLYQSLDGPVNEWAVPDSFLNPGTTYYWKVRARDSRGAVGKWSKVFSFKTATDANLSNNSQ